MKVNGLRRKGNKPKRKPVTLIVGIICTDGIVVAGDSQTTWGSGKSWTANKMTELEHPFGRALIAESGAVLSSSKAIEHLKESASDKALFNEHGLPGLMALAIKKVRDDLRHQQFDCPSEEFQDFIGREELECELMAVHYEDSPKIDTIRLTMGLPNRAKSYFETVGSGSDLAAYLLTDLCVPDMDCETASVIAVHVIEIAKRHDPYCGGPTKLGILRRPTRHSPAEELKAGPEPPSYWEFLGGFYTPPIILSDLETTEIVKMVSEVETDTKQKRGEIIRDALKRKSEVRIKEMLAGFDALGPNFSRYEIKKPKDGNIP